MAYLMELDKLNIIMELFILGIGKMVYRMDKGNLFF